MVGFPFRLRSTEELVVEFALLAGGRPEEIYEAGKTLPPGVADLYAARQKLDYIGIGQHVTVTKADLKNLI